MEIYPPVTASAFEVSVISKATMMTPRFAYRLVPYVLKASRIGILRIKRPWLAVPSRVASVKRRIESFRIYPTIADRKSRTLFLRHRTRHLAVADVSLGKSVTGELEAYHTSGLRPGESGPESTSQLW